LEKRWSSISKFSIGKNVLDLVIAVKGENKEAKHI